MEYKSCIGMKIFCKLGGHFSHKWKADVLDVEPKWKWKEDDSNIFLFFLAELE